MPEKRMTRRKKAKAGKSEDKPVKTQGEAEDILEVKSVVAESSSGGVSQVVEVVEEEKPEIKEEREASFGFEKAKEESEIKSESFKESSQVKEDVDEAEEDEDFPIDTSESTGDPESEKQKEVVKELFKKKEGAFSADISLSEKAQPKSIILWVALTLVAVFLIGGSLLLFAGGGKSSFTLFAKPSPTPTLAPSSEVVPEPEATIDITALSIEVLNGSGIKGSAGKMKEFLEGKGYTVASTGNASDYDYEKTEVSVKESKAQFLDLLESDLGKEYVIGTSSSALDANSKYDVQIIVGKE